MEPREERARMPMSITGRWNRRLVKPGSTGHPRGFTLIELTMVILLVGFLLSLTMPGLRDATLGDNLKSTVRILTSTIKELRYQAIKNNQEYFLKFDFGSKKFWTDSPYLSEEDRIAAIENSFSPPSDVRIIDIYLKGEEKNSSGEIGISFTKEGYIYPSIIHLVSEDGRQVTIALMPFLGSVNVMEGYAEIEDVEM
jgi:prepilin-type N-terminal cleavage/methylation domain-containing protein